MNEREDYQRLKFYPKGKKLFFLNFIYKLLEDKTARITFVLHFESVVTN